MVYFKLKKIIIISICIFIFFNIYNKVSAISIDIDNNYVSNGVLNLPSFIEEDNYNFFLSYYFRSNGNIALSLVISQGDLYINENMANYPTFDTFTMKSNSTLYYSNFDNTFDNVKQALETRPLSGYNTSSYASVPNLTKHSDRIGVSNIDIFDTAQHLYCQKTDFNTFSYPYFDNVNEIENGYPNGVFVSRGDFSYDDNLYFHLLKITHTISDNNNTIYYYSPKIFLLNKNSKYYRTWENDTDNEHSYYYISRSELGLEPDTDYLYVLSNSSESYNNSVGILDVDIPLGIYDVIVSNTTGALTIQDSINDNIQNIDNTLNDTTPNDSINNDISNSLDFDNNNQDLSNNHDGFFTRLSTMLSNLLGYNLGEDTSVVLPLPNSNQPIILHSKDIYDHVIGPLRIIINAFWIYIFTFYMWKFINKIYIAVSTGNILDTFSSSGEAITNDML